jgi:hypothetical protein
VRGLDTAVLSRLLLSVFVEASLMLGQAKNVRATRAALRVALRGLVGGLIVEP